MKHDTAGDPESGLKWTRKTTEKIAHQLNSVGIKVGSNTVGKLLKQLGFSLRVNHKKISTCSGPERDEQFLYLSSIRDKFIADGLPVISVDTKKKELVGNFHNKGVTWEQNPVNVNDHDFRSLAKGLAAPYGIYDIRCNQGFVCVGNSYDTPYPHMIDSNPANRRRCCSSSRLTKSIIEALTSSECHRLSDYVFFLAV